jgi:methionine-rich copper-binding protein CopC
MQRPERIAIAIIAGFGLPPLAYAHAALIKAVPGSRAVVRAMPSRIELCFNEAIELKFSSVHLLDAKGASLRLGNVQPGRDPRCLAVGIAAVGLSAGVYTVNYRVLSQDGHVVEYGYQFTVNPEPDSR